jgi:hypothetical protein
MNQKFIVLYLGLKGMSAIDAHDDYVATLKSEAVCYDSVTRSFRNRSFTGVTDPNPNVQTDPVFTQSDEVIVAALEDQPFRSVRQFT